ncbi:MAG: hypothetical protein MZU91_07715 [Desulfosudis oleivorans]|nr:hypothetical protein [Desulfosudis oleivorans]
MPATALERRLSALGRAQCALPARRHPGAEGLQRAPDRGDARRPSGPGLRTARRSCLRGTHAGERGLCRAPGPLA